MKSRKLLHEKRTSIDNSKRFLNGYFLTHAVLLCIVNKIKESQVDINKLTEYENLAIEM